MTIKSAVITFKTMTITKNQTIYKVIAKLLNEVEIC